MDDLDPRIDALYAGPPALFTKARDALAREMAAEGDRAGAAAARALRRPSALAAELNRLARVDPARMDALMEAQDALAGAQRRVLDGSGDATALRAAERAESDAVGAFPGGPPVHAALRFAARSPAMRDELRRGALSRDPAPSDGGEGPFSLGPAAAPPSPPRDELAEARAKRAARQAGSAPGDGAGPAAEATSAADEAARATREAERAVTLRAVTAALDETRTAERAALAARDAARPRAEEAAVAADRAGGDRERLRRELAGAEERVDAAERERADAKAALAAAQAAAEEARVERERAERAAREALEEASHD